MKLIVGLGNPGEKYQNTRHNLGFRVVEEFSSKFKDQSSKWENKKQFKAEILRLNYTLIKPQTFMNNSGIAVRIVAGYYRIEPQDIIVVYDELDLPLGKIKVRIGGAAAGHHGVESIIKHLGTDKFIRVRLGIGNLRTLSGEHKGEHIQAEKFVLEPFMPKEKPELKRMLKKALKALDLILEKGLESAQNQYN